ncbi:hypothetical protein K437DRAFT_279478 [Tilletiaria anomala UBC 951]|uniref:BRCT domain-containing protein n=1 Tax=Tilletiaria anomala (strain ATCC 24038 / CBS 436.72 / UBC 951) TaxID=1037660 RepID=A0A066VIS9_TILAU|nr:uncharacterized protein K437DRAFT_279478 [Tilletiaria anomala UBC 951]KDN38639.1 hypothetical protein K437DRAFT_279478 [Tilletiaria anomala UBC 951]
MPASHNDEYFTFTVGKLDAGMAILIGERASLIEFPSLLLPQGVSSGSVVNIKVLRNENEEWRHKEEFEELQEDILDTFGKVGPAAPTLRLRNVTQTSVTLEWDRIFLASASLIGLDIFRNGQRLAPIPNPLHNTSTKLSGLDVDADYSFHLLLRTTAGTLSSLPVKTRTHTVQDTSGIAVCFGHIEDPELEEAAKDVLKLMGCQKWTEKIQIETTHFICTDPRNKGDGVKGSMGTMHNKAAQLSIPIVQPHWLFACYTQKRMVPISAYYLGQDPPNASTIRETVAQIRQPPSSSASDATHMMPPTPVTANGMEPQTPSHVPHIDAQTGETRTGGVSVREGMPVGVVTAAETDTEQGDMTSNASSQAQAPAASEDSAATPLATPQSTLNASAEVEDDSANTVPPMPFEKDAQYANIGAAATSAPTGYAQAAALVPQNRVVAGMEVPTPEYTAAAHDHGGEQEPEQLSAAATVGVASNAADNLGDVSLVTTDDPGLPEEEEIDLS